MESVEELEEISPKIFDAIFSDQPEIMYLAILSFTEPPASLSVTTSLSKKL